MMVYGELAGPRCATTVPDALFGMGTSSMKGLPSMKTDSTGPLATAGPMYLPPCACARTLTFVGFMGRDYRSAKVSAPLHARHQPPPAHHVRVEAEQLADALGLHHGARRVVDGDRAALHDDHAVAVRGGPVQVVRGV